MKAKRFTLVQPTMKIISFTEILIEEKSIWQKQGKLKTKMVISLMNLLHIQIIGL